MRFVSTLGRETSLARRELDPQGMFKSVLAGLATGRPAVTILTAPVDQGADMHSTVFVGTTAEAAAQQGSATKVLAKHR